MVNGFLLGNLKVLVNNLTANQRYRFIEKIRENGFKLMYGNWGYFKLVDLEDDTVTTEEIKKLTPVGFISPYKPWNRDKNNCVILMNTERDNLRKYHNLLEEIVKEL